MTKSEKNSALMRSWWAANPEQRQQQSERMLQKLACPEFRAKQTQHLQKPGSLEAMRAAFRRRRDALWFGALDDELRRLLAGGAKIKRMERRLGFYWGTIKRRMNDLELTR